MKRWLAILGLVLAGPLFGQTLLVIFTTNGTTIATGPIATNKTITTGTLYLQYGTNRVLYFTQELICHVSITGASNAGWFEPVPNPGNPDRLRFFIQHLNLLETNQ